MIFLNQPLTGLISSLRKLFNWKFFCGLIVPVGFFDRKLAKVFVRMISVYNQTELLSKLPALTFLSRSQSTIADFPKYPSLEISQKSTLLYQTGWMELANWGGNSFLRNCKPKILRKFWLNFFNQYLPWFFCYFCWTLCLRMFVFGTSDWKLYVIIRQKLHYWMSCL